MKTAFFESKQASVCSLSSSSSTRHTLSLFHLTLHDSIMSDDEQHNHNFEQVRFFLCSARHSLIVDPQPRPALGPPRPSPCNARPCGRTGTSS